MRARQEHGLPVVVAGAGLAGLAAGAAAAQAGARVIILESGVVGGRARTEARDGFRFNHGPHALFRAGPGRRVLSRLGIKPAGHWPPLWGAQTLIAGCPQRFPVAQAGLVAARVAAARPARWAGASAAEWIESLRLRGDAAVLAEAGVRLTTYVADLGRLPASLAITQMRSAVRGVSYLDRGWEQLTLALQARAAADGAQIRQHAQVEHVAGKPGAWEVHTGWEVISAAAVVVAVGRPAAARRLLPPQPAWKNLGPPVTAACLDLGLRHPGTRLVLGIDEPLYLSPHAPPGDLAPPGCGLVHVMRYGATKAADDREQLWALAAAAGVRRADVMVERFLPRMEVVTCLPAPRQGLAGRPPVVLPPAPGLFLAGDWVGPEGWLSDGSLASRERAGLLAAAAAASQAPRPPPHPAVEDGKIARTRMSYLDAPDVLPLLHTRCYRSRMSTCFRSRRKHGHAEASADRPGRRRRHAHSRHQPRNASFSRREASRCAISLAAERRPRGEGRMKIRNRHERIVAAPPERIAALLADFNRFWPTEIGPAPRPQGHHLYAAGLMLWEEFDRPGAARAFRVVRPDELRLEHWFELVPGDGATIVRHTVEGCALGKYETIWRKRIEPHHDLTLEALLDNVEAAVASAD
jgi:phytoene dehydrogenase-like protein